MDDALGLFSEKLMALLANKESQAAVIKPKRTHVSQSADKPSRMAMQAIRPLPPKRGSKADRAAKEALLKD